MDRLTHIAAICLLGSGSMAAASRLDQNTLIPVGILVTCVAAAIAITWKARGEHHLILRLEDSQKKQSNLMRGLARVVMQERQKRREMRNLLQAVARQVLHEEDVKTIERIEHTGPACPADETVYDMQVQELLDNDADDDG